MKVIIAGSRDFHNYELLRETLESLNWTITTVISGTAKGADRLGERWAAENNVPVERFAPDWARHGKKAGYLRNQEMAKHADALVAFRINGSAGTTHMINIADELKLKKYVVDINT